MKSQDASARRVKKRLWQARFRVTLVDPALAAEIKKVSRRRDRELLDSGKATPDEIQRKNSILGGLGKRCRIVNYGGLDEEP